MRSSGSSKRRRRRRRGRPCLSSETPAGAGPCGEKCGYAWLPKGHAEAFYSDQASRLQQLLNMMARDAALTDSEWLAIGGELRRIAGMKQSACGWVWENLISYGQGSLIEQQGMALGGLCTRLELDHPQYRYTRSWGDFFADRPRRYVRIGLK